MDPQVTATELTTDPLTLGYAGAADSQAKADLLNEVPAAPEAGRQRERQVVDAHLILGACDPTELAALSAGDSTIFWGLLGMGEVNIQDGNTRLILRNVFQPGSTTRANLIALKNEPISRWAFLGGTGMARVGDIEQAEAI